MNLQHFLVVFPAMQKGILVVGGGVMEFTGFCTVYFVCTPIYPVMLTRGLCESAKTSFTDTELLIVL